MDWRCFENSRAYLRDPSFPPCVNAMSRPSKISTNAAISLMSIGEYLVQYSDLKQTVQLSLIT
jgi:hypothetical protein